MTTPANEFYISVYTIGKRALAVIVNKNKTAQKIKLNIDYKGLGLPENSALKDFRTGRKLTSQNLEAWDVKGYNFSLIQIGE